MRPPGFLLLTVLFTATVAATPAVTNLTATAEQTCPPGTSPPSTARYGEMFLPDGALPYSVIGVYRHTLQPGETMTTKQDVPVMYIVESGVLHYPLQSWTGTSLGTSCSPDPDTLPAIGEYTVIGEYIVTGGGSISVTADDEEVVTAGQTLIAEHGLVGPLRNGGSEPLVVIQIILRTPKIDPVSGLPIVDSITAHRERDRAFALRRQECRERLRAIMRGTPVAGPPDFSGTPEPTPSFTTADDENGVERERRTFPRICHFT